MARNGGIAGLARGLRWSWAGGLMWLAVAGAALLTYATRVRWEFVQIANALPHSEIPQLVWTAVGSDWGLYPLLIPIFGLGSATPGNIGLLAKALPIAGVALALAMVIWRRSRIAAFAYIAWLSVATLDLAAMVYGLFGRPVQTLCAFGCDYGVIVARHVTSGVWLALAALAMLWVAAGARLSGWRVATATASLMPSASLSRKRFSLVRIGALIYTLGMATWLFGFIFTPYATQGCTGFPVNWAHFVSGSCAGLDANDAMGFTWFSDHGYVYALLGITLLLMLVALNAIWQHGWVAPAFAIVWAALASCLMTLALMGLPGMLRRPPGLSVSTAPWVTGAGPAVTAWGALTLWVGALVLVGGWAAAWRNRWGERIQGESASAA